MMSENFFVKTFGCKTNQIESEYVIDLLKKNGLNKVENILKADFCIVNSCTVTLEADKKVLKFISAVKKKNPDIKIILLGCFVQTHKDEILSNVDIDIALGNQEKLKILDFINQDNKVINISNIFETKEFIKYDVSKIERTRANLKIQDGCNNRCSYCIIPFARGNSRSNNLENIIKQINLLDKNNYKEVILTGIHIGQWGLDLVPKKNFLDLIYEIEKTNIHRYRLGSLTPDEISDKLLDSLKKSSKFCHHFHLSLQSLCTKILKNMNRKYTQDQCMDLIEKIKDYFPDAFIGADIIVGFPDESYDDFITTYNNIKKSKLSKVHVFPYSIRPNTLAKSMKNQIDQFEKHKRGKIIQELSDQKYNQFLDQNLETYQEIILEPKLSKEYKGYYQGVTCNYINVLSPDYSTKPLKVLLKKKINDKIIIE